MPRYVFHMQVADGATDRLRELNAEYADALSRAASGIAGLRSIEKYLLGDEYVELIDFDGEFADFSTQLTADKEVRQFLRSVNECFVQSLRDMPDRAMATIQSLPG
jgi:hypothetical protein